jgi:hypothetical protein
LSPLKRVTQTFQRDSLHVSNAGFVPRSAKWSAVALTIQIATIAVRIFQTWWRFHADSTPSKVSRHDALSPNSAGLAQSQAPSPEASLMSLSVCEADAGWAPTPTTGVV